MGPATNQIRPLTAIANRTGPRGLCCWASARPRRTPGLHRVAPLDPLQQIAESRCADGYRSAHRRRPGEPAPFQTLGIKRYPDTVVPENLQEIASASAEDLEIPHMGIAPKLLLNLQRQRVHAPTHVRDPGRKPDPKPARNRDDRRSSTAITRDSAEESTARSTITRQSPASTISIRPVAGNSSAPTSSGGRQSPP